MPLRTPIFYKDTGGNAPALAWLDQLPDKALVKCRARLELLKERGHELHRPFAAYLRDDIYELRVRLGAANYRLLYFFHGQAVIIISHGLVKERNVPPKEIDAAVEHKRLYVASPEIHTYREEQP